MYHFLSKSCNTKQKYFFQLIPSSNNAIIYITFMNDAFSAMVALTIDINKVIIILVEYMI